ncbi:MAG TPA: Ig-like domain-containing protein [Candidatus Scatovivens faecipullorum]|nr:Ig-like domain-containing protein [Candidatus Scatovivens faecipullorum]
MQSISSAEASSTTSIIKLAVLEKLLEIYAQRVEIYVENIELLIENTAKISAIMYPQNTTNKTITGTSSDENICKIDSEGNVLANNIGKATIIAKISNGKQASIEVGVNLIKVIQRNL